MKYSLSNDIVTAQISDHYPIIHDGVFFWNIMMQCGLRRGGLSYNNGFGLIESNDQYLNRLARVAEVIAEAIYVDNSIEVINICEGPIQPKHVEYLFQALMNFPWMARFMGKRNSIEQILLGKTGGCSC